jgi:hypothetical protein
VTQLPGIVEKDDIATRSFNTAEEDIRGVGFLDSARGVVLLMTCGSSQCASKDDANALAQTIYGRIKSLLPTMTGSAK